MRKKIMPIIVAVIFVIVIALIAICTAFIQKYIPSKDPSDLNKYYKLSQEDDMAVILNHEKTDQSCRYMDGRAYVTIDYVHEMLNPRFYWDANENVMRYTTPTDLISVEPGTGDYYVSKEKNTEPYTIVRVDGDTMYLALDFVKKYTNIDFSLQENPNRVMLTTVWGDISVTTLKKKTQIREKAGIKSPVVAELDKGTKVIVTDSETVEDWMRVCTEDGMIGYLKSKTVGPIQQETISSDFQEPIFSHLLKNEKIIMAWHQVTSEEANDSLVDVLQDTKGINVLSPTWFYLKDNEGNIESLASSSYVNYCHQNGIEVWGLISNLENPEVDTTYVLTHSSTRDYLTNKIIAAAIEYDLDGINLDFEELSVEVGDSYVQFVRELSLKCKNNGIVLSVDNYVPSEFTMFYNRKEQAVFADYIVIMGYDEHYNGSGEGSGASIGFVTRGVQDTLLEVPPEQVILGMPFYTRVWECVPKSEDVPEQEKAAEDYVPYTVDSMAVGMEEVERRILLNEAEKTWSDEDGQYYTEYQNEGNTYKIWVEDEASMEPRLQLAKEHDLAGASFWKLGLEKSSIWDSVIKYIN